MLSETLLAGPYKHLKVATNLRIVCVVVGVLSVAVWYLDVFVFIFFFKGSPSPGY